MQIDINVAVAVAVAVTVAVFVVVAVFCPGHETLLFRSSLSSPDQRLAFFGASERWGTY